MAAVPEAWAVVVAAGRGSRFGGYKQFAVLAGREVVEWSLDVARRTCAGVVLVVPASLVDVYEARADRVVAGGKTRTASVAAGLSAVPSAVDLVVVHDAARPLAGEQLWLRVISAVAAGCDAAVPCVAVADTIKLRSEDGRLVTLDRARLVASQTPQGFSAGALREAHARARAAGEEATDDAALVEAMGGRVVEVEGESTNLKLTRSTDLEVAATLLSALGREHPSALGREHPSALAHERPSYFGSAR
jgi:2-C-methyl-D-erythritol 4-phosphate cytidylyltransferase